MITKALRLTLLLSLLACAGWADQFSFLCLTGNNATNCAIGEAQLTVDVTDPGVPGGEDVLFTFKNSGPLASSITDVYFDDGSLLGIASIVNMPGVDFSQFASPANLPGGASASPPFVTSAGFSADSNPPTQPNGVNPDEQLGILFNLQSGQTFANVIDELGTGELRIGIHVQGFANDGSEAFINNPGGGGGPTEVPEPTTMLLVGAGLVTLSGVARRRLRRG